MKYIEYKKKMLWKRVDFDSAYGYQCVDLIKDYMCSVFGIKVYKSWNANEIRTNKYRIFDKRRKKVVGTSNLIQWDIIVSLKGKYWHIAIVDDKYNVLEQNGSWKNSGSWIWANAIRVKQYPLSFWVWVWRYVW